MSLYERVVAWLASAAGWSALSLALVLSLPALASDLPDPFAGIGVEPQLGTSVPTGLEFRDENGREVRLGDYLGRRPVILAPVYYSCPNLCGSTLADLAFALQRVPLGPGRDYEMVAVSIDPRERPADAAAAKSRAIAGAGSAELSQAAHFLTASESFVAELTRAIGFRYRWDAQLQQYAHVSGIALLTPDGRLARWLAGVGLEPQGPAPGARRGGAGRSGRPGRSIHAALLPLRCADRAIHRPHRPRAEDQCSPHSIGDRRSDWRRAAPRAATAAAAGAGRVMNGAPLWPASISQYAREVDWIVFGFTALLMILVVPIFVALVWFAIKYRQGYPAERTHKISHSVAIEIGWMAIPFALSLIFFFWAAGLFYRLYHAPEGALAIDVVAKQWMWKFRHPGGQREINELHVPTGEPVKLTMISQDVIHSLFLPALRIKQDVLPDRYTSLWFDADQPGEYLLECAEFCGTEHSHMAGRLIVMAPADYQY
jgi:cytochrome c oxidase subunit II